MSTSSATYDEQDTQRVPRHELPRPRLDDLDLDPPEGPVPAEVIARFEAALAREAARRPAA